MTRVLKERTFSGTRDPKVQDWETEHRQLAKEAAAEGIVLLKNEDQLLPLKAGSKVALYGAGAGRTIKGGTGSGDVNERERVTIWQGMKNAGFEITSEDWIRSYEKIYEKARQDWKDDIVTRSGGNGGNVMDFFTVYSTTPFVMPTGDPVEKPEKEKTDTAIYVLSRVAGEGADRNAAKGDYYLKEDEHQMLSDLCNYYKNVIVVVNAGGQVDLSFMDEFSNIKALLILSQPGMEGGNAFADVISGKVNPSGKLVDSWAYRYEDYPNAASFSHNNGNVEKEFYEEGIYVGYRYFDTFAVPVRYGFGYGLSYTTFEIKEKNIQCDNEHNIQISISVKNTGDTAGKEVVQIYAALPGGQVEKEAHRLVAYEKTALLQPQEEQTLTFKISADRFTFYAEEKAAWVLEKGFYGIFVGTSLESATLAGGLKLEQDVILEKVKNLFPLKESLKELQQKSGQTEKREDALKVQAVEKGLPVLEIGAAGFEAKEIFYKKNSELVEKEAAEFVDTLSIEELIDLAAGDPGKAQGGNLGAAGISVPGSAGETHRCAIEKGLASIVLADGPAGLRLMKYYHVNAGRIVSMPFEFSLEGGLFYDGPTDLPGERYYQYCTAIPVGTMLAQTWNTGLIQEVGAMIGKEMEYFGVTLWLAPGMNIHRNPLCGRNFEYYSEDPLIAGKMGAAMVKGIQSQHIAASVKHFAANNKETNRKHSDSRISERALREIYLRVFEIIVKEAQPWTIMSSYNAINGHRASENHELLEDILRGEWGFKGMVTTDWWTRAEHYKEIKAGNDIKMGTGFPDRVKKAMEMGQLGRPELEHCARRVLELILKID